MIKCTKLKIEIRKKKTNHTLISKILKHANTSRWDNLFFRNETFTTKSCGEDF